MDVMTLRGEVDYTSEDGMYQGKAKHYSMHLTKPSDFYFWCREPHRTVPRTVNPNPNRRYITDMQDKPLEQGEGPCDFKAYDGTRNNGNCASPAPHMLFHQYHPASFKSATIDPSVFALPEICKKTPYTYCMVQPTNFCG